MSLQAGSTLGPYEIVSRLGSGGMSEVYRAHDPRIRRDVALKVLPPTWAKYADRMHRFEQEARAIGALNHPNLLTIFDTGRADGRPYIVTELLEGETLRELLREGGTAVRLPIRRAVDYAIQIANGLAAAHERGVVHRDLKPENLFVTRDGRVKILDFGVAKLRSEDGFAFADDTTMEQDTSPGTVLGTVGYMSPEQVRGQAVDGRSDLFSLGTVMFEMMAAAHPFRSASPADTMTAILREDPPELAAINPNVTPGLERVVRHCLEKNPEQRFQSARDLAFQLETLSTGSGVMPTMELPVMTGARNRRWLLAVALATGGLVAGWIIGSMLDAGRETRLHFSQLTYEEGAELTPSLSPDARSIVFSASRNGASSDLFLQRVGGRNAINLTSRCTSPDTMPAFSPDGAQIAWRSECDGGGIFVMGATGESTRRVTDSCYNPSWSPDGKSIVCGTEGVMFTPTSRGRLSSLWIANVGDGARRLLLDRDGVQPSWSPNGHRIAYWGIVGASAQRDIWTIDPSAANPRATIVRVTNDAALDWNPVWSGDGRYLYFASDRGGAMNVWRIRIEEDSGRTRGEPERVTLPSRFPAGVSIARNEGGLAWSSIEATESVRVAAFDPATGAIARGARPVMAGSLMVFSSRISPDGRFVALTNRGGQEDVFIVEVATGDIRQLTNDAAPDRGVSWAQDGSRLFFYSQRGSRGYEIWSINVDGSGLSRVATNASRSIWYPSASRDGKLAYYDDETTYVLEKGRTAALPRGADGAMPALTSWSPDGSMLAGELRGVPGIAVYSLRDRRYTQVTSQGGAPHFLPDGRSILYSDAGRLKIVDIATRAVRDVPSSGGMVAVSVSADGRAISWSERRVEADVWLARSEE